MPFQTRNLLMSLGAASALGACTTMADVPTERVGQATLSYANGMPAGTAQLMRSGEGLSMAVAVTGMSPGTHAFHLHTTGKCEGPDFTSAGGHLNPYDKKHGTLDPMGPHLGDMQNLEVNSSGAATATVDIPGERAGALQEIFDADGTAVVIHAGADDYRTDPSGAAGSRIACGIMRPA
ncbi:superoxide dismutase family protein [Qipengyuania sp.]|uniref:superoxide dismutase family protein n=1 Tax=Qipengyuania sp. TaxID=2004515 RepID=UPI0035C82200